MSDHIGFIEGSRTIRFHNRLVGDTEYTEETCTAKLSLGLKMNEECMTRTDSKCTDLSFIWVAFG
jgi:hypothetical protein